MVENIVNNIDDKHEIKSETPDENFDEGKNKKQIQAITQEREKAEREQREESLRLFQQNFDNASTLNGNIGSQPIENESQWNKKDEEINHVKELVSKNDIEWICKYLWLDIELINTIKKIDSLKKTKRIADIADFLENEDEILEETQEKYEELHKKIMDNDFIKLIIKLFNQLERMNDNRMFGNIYKRFMHKKIKKNIIKIKERKKDLKKISKYLKKLNKYENWEYIDFPNWISFELWKWPETINWTNIKIWENEFYIKTHIEKNWKNKKTKYIEYFDSLKKARKLFEKKWIQLKYCKRHTRLANREFIEAYEKERQKRKEKEWANYEKSNILKVLEQTEYAVISEKAEEVNQEEPNKNSIRFINKDSDLYKFATGEGKELFHRTEMRLDLDLL